MKMNKKVSSIVALPPLVRQYFDAQLLSAPMPKFGDDADSIWRAYSNIIERLEKKVAYNTITQARFNILKNEFLEIYGRTATKEKECKGQSGNATEGPFYYITVSSKRDREIFSRLKFRTRSSSKRIWGNY